MITGGMESIKVHFPAVMWDMLLEMGVNPDGSVNATQATGSALL